jgi:hypothetical protein
MAALSGVTIGSNVFLIYSRFGIEEGKILKVVSMTADYRLGQIELGLWGPA